MSTVFERDDFHTDDDLPIGGGPKKTVLEETIPDDYEIEELRGKPVKDVLGQIASLSGKIKELENRPPQPIIVKNEPPPPPPKPAGVELKPEDYMITDQDMLDSTGKALNEKLDNLFAAKIGPLLREDLQMKSEHAMYIAKGDVRNNKWDDYEQDILALATKLPLARTSLVSTWHALYKQVAQSRGDDVNEEVERRLAARLKELGIQPDTTKSGERPLPGTERGRPGNEAARAKLSQDQADAARALGVDPTEAEQYA